MDHSVSKYAIMLVLLMQVPYKSKQVNIQTMGNLVTNYTDFT